MLTYEVTAPSPGVRASMTYTAEGGGTSQMGDEPLPWTYSRPAKSIGSFAYIAAQKQDGGTGCITAVIKIDGAVVKRGESCGPYTIANASGRLR